MKLVISVVALSLVLSSSVYAQDTVHVKAGWNIIGGVSPGLWTDILATEPAGILLTQFHGYELGTGYSSTDTLKKGAGFWVKVSEDGIIIHQPRALARDTVSLKAGWNIVGALASGYYPSLLITEPPDLITAGFYGYSPATGYRSTDTVIKGQGYWVKADTEGVIIWHPYHGEACPGIPTVDHGGKIYNTVQIGTQCWLRENLDVGVMIEGSQEAADNGTIEKYCYGNNPANCDTFGGLYPWNEAMQYNTAPGSQGICPPGWHTPTLAEFNTLTSAIGGDGNALKAIGQGSGDGAGTNTSGFYALIAGDWRREDGWGRPSFYFEMLGTYTYFWSSTVLPTTYPNYLSLYAGDSLVSLGYDAPTYFGISVRCIENEGSPPNAPSAPSPAEGETVESLSVQLSWFCDDPDGDPLTYDVFLGTENPPTTKIGANLTTPGKLYGALDDGTVYFWKVDASDGHGNITEGPVWSFSSGGPFGAPCPGTPTVDYGGKIYNTVLIGSQCWLKENLDIGSMVAGTIDQGDNGTLEKYCFWDNPANCEMYGGLYQWDEAMQYTTVPGTQGICPPGWHIPTLAEFDTLKTTVVGDGNSLKAVGQGISPDGQGTNTSGFSALLAGYRHFADGRFYALGYYAFFWSSTEVDALSAYYLTLFKENSDINLYFIFVNYRVHGLSVRCLEDQTTRLGMVK